MISRPIKFRKAKIKRVLVKFKNKRKQPKQGLEERLTPADEAN